MLDAVIAGCQTLTRVTDESGFMEKHLLKSLCADVVNLLLEANASHYFIELSGSVLKASDRSGVLKKLKDKPLHEALAALDASLTESVDVFLDKLWDVTEKMDIRLRNLDKRSERELLESHKFSLREQLQQERNPSHAYHLAVLVVYAKAHHVVLHVPGKSISDIFPYAIFHSVSFCLFVSLTLFLFILLYGSLLTHNLAAQWHAARPDL